MYARAFRQVYLFVRWLDPRHEHPIAVDKLNKGVADGISCTADANGLHHPRVPELTHTELPVKELPGRQSTVRKKYFIIYFKDIFISRHLKYNQKHNLHVFPLNVVKRISPDSRGWRYETFRISLVSQLVT